MYTSISGKVAVTKQMELIANNLANASTTGYKAERPLFEKALSTQNKLLSSSLRKDIAAPNNLSTESFIQLRGSFSDLTQGAIETTSNPLDVAIDGPGFFVVQTEAGERYTRAGNFRLDDQNRLVTQNGDPVQGSGGDITITGANINVASDGTVVADGVTVGQLRLVTFDSTQSRREGGQLFSASGGATDIVSPKVQGGALEGSNVNAVRELTDMIMASRLFESFKNVDDAASRMNQARNEKLGTTQG